MLISSLAFSPIHGSKPTKCVLFHSPGLPAALMPWDLLQFCAKAGMFDKVHVCACFRGAAGARRIADCPGVLSQGKQRGTKGRGLFEQHFLYYLEAAAGALEVHMRRHNMAET